MDYTAYSKNFTDKDTATKELSQLIAKAFIENIDKIQITNQIEGHKIRLFSNFETYKEDKQLLESRIINFAQKITSDIVNQSDTIDMMRQLLGDKYKEEKIDINQILLGNLDWNKKTVFNPSSTILECGNDGKKYIFSMQDWNVKFYDYNDFVIKHQKNDIQVFKYGNAPVKEKIEFSTGNLLIFNYLPKEINDYLESNFEDSLYNYKGRDWNKFLGEMNLAVGIVRTPTHIGGNVLLDKNNIVTGIITTYTEPDNFIGQTDTGVWQTLIADEDALTKLVMSALKINKDNAIKYIDTNIYNEQSGIKCHVTPGIYNIAYIPEMNSCGDNDMKKIYGQQNIKGYEQINPDIFITEHEIAINHVIDDIKVISKNEIQNLQDIFQKDLDKITSINKRKSPEP